MSNGRGTGGAGRRYFFTLDAGDNYSIIKIGNEVVWRERARVEDWDRFEQVKRLLKKKSGGRLRSLTPTDAARTNLPDST